MRYARSKIILANHEEAYRIYIAKGIEVLAQLNISYLDIMKPEETRSADEIKQNIVCGLQAAINGREEDA